MSFSIIEEYFSTALTLSTDIQVLEYTKGCFYIKHSDDSSELLFNYLKESEGNTIKLEPKARDMIVFPSNPYFSHEVLKVKEDYRLTLVQWHDGIV